MNSTLAQRRAGAFTMVEMLVVIAIISLLLAMLLPVLVAGKQRAKRAVCESQLRQIGLGFQNFAHDHNSKFPMRVPAGDGGSLEYAQVGSLTNSQFYFGFRHFQTLAGSLQTPAVLVCPADTRPAATNFSSLQNSNVSYFVAVTADYFQPMSILAGDGNLASASTLVQGNAGGRLTWTREMHQFKGNVLFADGHVEEWADLGPSRLSNRSELVLPSVNRGDRHSNSHAPSDPSAFPDTPNGNTGAPTSQATGPSDAGTNQPAAPSFTTAHVSAPAHAAGGGAANTVYSAPNISDNSVSTNAVNTNKAGGGGGVRPDDDDSSMSPFDRKIAKFLRDVIFGTYLMVLFLLLLFAGYRVWRYHNDPERQRRRSRSWRK